MLVNVIELIVSTTRVVVPADVLDRHVKAYLEEYLQQFGEFMALVVLSSLIFSSLIYPAFLATCACKTCMKWEKKTKRKIQAWCKSRH